VLGRRRNEILHLHLLELTRPQDEVAWGYFVTKRLTNLRNTKRQLATHRSLHIQKVNEYALCGFGSEIGERRGIVVGDCAQLGLQHRVEGASFRPIARATRRTFVVGDLVGSKSTLTLAAINQRIVEGCFVTRILPDETIENDRRIDSLDVVAFVDEPAPPGLLYVVAKLNAEWAIVPGAAESAVNFRRGKNKTSPLGERNDGVDVWCSHEYIKPQRSTKSTSRSISNHFALLCLCGVNYLLGV